MVVLVWNAVFWTVYPSTQSCYFPAKDFTLHYYTNLPFLKSYGWLIHKSPPRHRLNSIINDAIKLAKSFWHQSISVCQCYHSSQDGQSQHILLSLLPEDTPQYALHLMAFLWSTVFPQYRRYTPVSMYLLYPIAGLSYWGEAPQIATVYYTLMRGPKGYTIKRHLLVCCYDFPVS